MVGVTHVVEDNQDKGKEENGQNKDKDKKDKDRTSGVPGLGLSDGSSADGTGVSVPPEPREATDQEALDAGPDEAADDGEGPATGGDLTGDLGLDLLLTTGAGDELSFVGELDFRTGSLRWGTGTGTGTGSVDCDPRWS